MWRQVLDHSAPGRAELQGREGVTKDIHVTAQNGELDIVVIARLPAMPQVERPTADDAPGFLHILQMPAEFKWMPWPPCVVSRQCGGLRHLRDRSSMRPMASVI